MNIVKVFYVFLHKISEMANKFLEWQFHWYKDNFIQLKIEFQIPRQSVTSKSKLVHRCLVLASFHMRD